MSKCPLPMLSKNDICENLEHGKECSPECRKTLRWIINKHYEWLCVVAVRTMNMAEEIRGGYRCPHCDCYISQDTYERDLSLCYMCETILEF